MPYIKSEDRERINTTDCWGADPVTINHIENAGEIQYAIARIIQSYIERKGLNYQHCNDVMGALAGAQMEFYRRVVAPYEQEKIKQNGDI